MGHHLSTSSTLKQNFTSAATGPSTPNRTKAAPAPLAKPPVETPREGKIKTPKIYESAIKFYLRRHEDLKTLAELREKELPLTSSQKKVLGACWLVLLLSSIGLACWFAGSVPTRQQPIHFSQLAGSFVLQMCEMQPPLSTSSVAIKSMALKDVLRQFECVALDIFQIRHGVADEKPLELDECIHKNEVDGLRTLQTIDSHFRPFTICERLLKNTSIVCRPSMFTVEDVCPECVSIGSGVRMTWLYHRILELHERGWLSPHTTWNDARTMIVPLDTVLLAYVLSYSNLTRWVTAMELALVAAENLAIQDLTRPWETIERHAYRYSASNTLKRSSSPNGMTEFEFYWMLRIENFCANRYSHSRRKPSDKAYIMLLKNVIEDLFDSYT